MGTPNLRRIILPALAAVFFVAGCRIAPTLNRTIAPSSTPIPSQTAAPVATQTKLPTFVPSPTQTLLPTLGGCQNPERSVLDQQISSQLLGEPLVYKVYLPPCFSENPARPYPVLYLLHGQQQDATLWEGLGALDLADRAAFSESSRPFIIVMPTERRFLVDLQDTEYDRAVAEELIPAIDAAFPTCTDRSCRAIGGISRGGAWAVRIGFSHPELIGYIGAHSPAVFGAELSRLPVLLNRADLSEIPVVFIDTGRADNYRESAIKLESILTEYRVIHEWHLNEGQHEFKYWQEHIAEYFDWYSQNWR
jgi:enterochelin esterase-like enzyme